MEYIKRKIGTYNLHMIKTDRFKSSYIEVMFRDVISKERITKTNFLTNMLIYSNEFYKTKHEYIIATEELYGLTITTTNYRLGHYYNTDFNTTILNEEYTEKGMFEKSVKFLAETVLNPNIVNNKFDLEAFNVIKAKTIAKINRVKEDISRYSAIRMLETMDSKADYALHGYGYLDDLEEISVDSLYDYYKEFINDSIIDIYIVGNIEIEKTEELIRKYFNFKVLKKPKKTVLIEHGNVRMRPLKVVEEYDSEQANLCIGCKIKGLSDEERSYALTLYTSILGGMESKLFNTVREKNSLCYYIYSFTNKLDNLLMIMSGIDKGNFNKTNKLIKKEMNNMLKGKITEKELDIAKKEYLSSLDEIFDFPNKIVASYYAMELMNADSPEVRREKIQKVTVDMVAKVAKSIKIDTVFLLGGK